MERLQAGIWNTQLLLREIRERNYNGSYTLLTDWLRPLRQEALAVRRGDLKRHQAATDQNLGTLLRMHESAFQVFFDLLEQHKMGLAWKEEH